MHAFFITRGAKSEVEEFIKWIETRTTALPCYEPDGSKVRYYQPVAPIVQPVQLWSVVFPENHKDQMLEALQFDKEISDRRLHIGGKKGKSKKIQLGLEALRIALGAEKVPPIEKPQKSLFMTDAAQNVAVHPIGVKYDAWTTSPDGTKREAI